jgi:hypothetical protein
VYDAGQFFVRDEEELVVKKGKVGSERVQTLQLLAGFPGF